jgi:hypothetical protein
MSKSKTKKSESSQDDFEAELQSEAPVKKAEEPKLNFDSVAITIVKSSTGFNIVKVPLDSINLVAGTIEVIDVAGDKLEANEKFKINVVKHGIL